MGVDRSAVDRQWPVVQEWLLSADARAAARAEVRRLRLVGVDHDDIVSATSLRLWRSLDRRSSPVDEGDDGLGLIRYSRRALRNVALDALRGQRRRHEDPVDDIDRAAPGEPAADDDLDAVLDRVDTAAGGGDGATGPAGWLDDARRDLHAGLDRDAVAGAAALMTIGILADELTPADDVARPDRGATRTQAAGWAGLWFAGRRDLFPTDADAAARQRRSRAVRAVTRRVERAIEAVGGRG